MPFCHRLCACCGGDRCISGWGCEAPYTSPEDMVAVTTEELRTFWHAVRARLQKDCQDFGGNCTFLDWSAPDTTTDELGALTFSTMTKAW